MERVNVGVASFVAASAADAWKLYFEPITTLLGWAGRDPISTASSDAPLLTEQTAIIGRRLLSPWLAACVSFLAALAGAYVGHRYGTREVTALRHELSYSREYRSETLSERREMFDVPPRRSQRVIHGTYDGVTVILFDKASPRQYTEDVYVVIDDRYQGRLHVSRNDREDSTTLRLPKEGKHKWRAQAIETAYLPDGRLIVNHAMGEGVITVTANQQYSVQTFSSADRRITLSAGDAYGIATR